MSNIKIPNKEQYIGTKLNKLVLLEVFNDKSGHIKARCLCDCGKEKITTFLRWFRGGCKSCGCILSESMMINDQDYAKTTLFNTYKSSARRKKLEFSLTKEEIFHLANMNCYYCGDNPRQIKRFRGYYNGIDRVDSSRGYVLDNCVPCCTICNYFKNKFTEEFFLNHVNKIYNFQHQGQQKGR